MGNEKYLVLLHGDNDEDEALLSPEERATEEKARRRQWYICARVAVANLSEHIKRIESGVCASDNLEFLRAQLVHSHRRVAQLEAEFTNDPDIERDVQREIQATEDIARTLGQEKGVDK